MRIQPVNLRRAIARVLAAIGLVSVIIPCSRADEAGQKAVEETRTALRQQGFKADLGDFDFSTPPEFRDREAFLYATDPSRLPGQLVNHLNLMELIGSNSVAVVWALSSVKAEGDEISWTDYRAAVKTNQPYYDAACDAILSGPIRFNLMAGRGGALPLPHLAVMRNLMEALGSRTVVALHEGNLDLAWTNLMAASRLVTAWDVEPVETSQLVRLGLVSRAFDIIWQALQTNGWRDKQLEQLQSEWESPDFFSKLPQTAAFTCASDVDFCERERQQILAERPAFSEFFNKGAESVAPAPAQLDARWKRTQYAEHGSYEDQKALLLFYHNRELELADAVRAPSWSEMRQRPAGTNAAQFVSKYESVLQFRIRQRGMGAAFQGEGAGWLGRAAKAEAERRLVVAALALERYRGKHGRYPGDLAELAPEFVKERPIDFMDGKPLRYRAASNGHFLLYSVGLDGVDDGGQMERAIPARAKPGEAPPEGDLVWPLPASAALVESMRAAERKAREQQVELAEEAEAQTQWNQTARRQAEAADIAPIGPQTEPQPKYRGSLLSEVLRNKEAPGTNTFTLSELLTLKPVITGAEPETITYELPIGFEVLGAVGRLGLYIDANNVQQLEMKRATNGNCQFVWGTIYESPGPHKLQVGLTVDDADASGPQFGGPVVNYTVTNFCQFSLSSAIFDPGAGATLHAKLIEKNVRYSIDLLTTNGALLNTITGTTTNGILKEHWNLIDSKGARFTGDEFNSVFHVTLPDSGRSQTMKGP